MNLEKTKKNFLLKSSLTFDEKNKLASIYLELGQYDLAYKLLIENHEQNASLHSISNLAYFYLFIGEYGNDGRLYPNYNKAIKLLLNINDETEEMYIPYSLLGHAYSQISDYPNALKYFEKAYLIKQTLSTQMNYAFALYRNYKYDKAMEHFETAYTFDTSNVYIRYCYLFCKYLSLQEKASNKEIKTMIKKSSYNPSYDPNMIDMCYLLFLYEDYDATIKLYDIAMNNYTIEPIDFWIIAHSLLKINSISLIDKYYEIILDEYTFGYSNPLKEKIEQINSIYNKKLYLKRPQTILRTYKDGSCYFFNCVIHNT